MIKMETIDVFGWEAAIHGMRNPLNSWDKSDSDFDLFMNSDFHQFVIGENDLKLMNKLSKTGDDHGKFLRMINVQMNITAPLYWWKEFDTYKVGTVANSCSTMHTIHHKEFTLDDFSHEHLMDWSLYEKTIEVLNSYREKYNKTNDKKFWYHIIQTLPSSYNQKRTVQLNYQVLKTMYFARNRHKLDEWRDFCEFIKKDLPYFEEVCIKCYE